MLPPRTAATQSRIITPARSLPTIVLRSTMLFVVPARMTPEPTPVWKPVLRDGTALLLLFSIRLPTIVVPALGASSSPSWLLGTTPIMLSWNHEPTTVVRIEGAVSSFPKMVS